MDEVLEVTEVVVDSGLEGALAWILGAVGVLAILAGLGLWLFTQMGLLVLPAALIAVGVVLLAAPMLLVPLLEVVA